MSNVIVCDKCKHEFVLGQNDLLEEEVICKGSKILLIFFTCPKCNEIYKVSLEDEECALLKEDLIKTVKRIRRNFGNNDVAFSDKLNQMMLVKKERLKNYMTKLNAKYSGTFTFDTSENNKKERKIIYHE